MWSSSIVLLECWACVSVTLTPSRSTVPPLFGSRMLSSETAFFIQTSQSAQLDRRDDRAAVLLREIDRVADVVVVAVRDRDHVDALRLLLALGALRVRRARGRRRPASRRASRSGTWRGRARSVGRQASLSFLGDAAETNRGERAGKPHGLALSLEVERAQRLENRAGQLGGRGRADHDLAGLGFGLETRREVRRVADRGEAPSARARRRSRSPPGRCSRRPGSAATPVVRGRRPRRHRRSRARLARLAARDRAGRWRR